MANGGEQEDGAKGVHGIPVPELQANVSFQDFSRGLLGISDLARHLTGLYAGLRDGETDGGLTSYVRQMSVSLRSLLLERKGRLLTGVFGDGLFPSWRTVRGERLAHVVLEVSPHQEIEYEIKETGERRRVAVPGYKHGFVVDRLCGLAKSGDDRYAILSSEETWTGERLVSLRDWLDGEVFEVDGLVYDLRGTIRTVADKEGAHIDPVVESEGIYTGNSVSSQCSFSNDDAFIRSRLVKFGPFSYPQVIVICVSRVLVAMAKDSLATNARQMRSIENQLTLNSASLAAARERIDTINRCPRIGEINGLPLKLQPERLVMRPPIPLGLPSFEEEQAAMFGLPRYGETYIGVPGRR